MFRSAKRFLFVPIVFVAISGWVWAEGKELILPVVVNGPTGNSFFQTTITIMGQATTAVENSIVLTGVRDDPSSQAPLFCTPAIVILPPYDLETTRWGDFPPEGSLTYISSGESMVGLFEGWGRIDTGLVDSVAATAEVSIIRGNPAPCIIDGANIPRTDVAQRGSEQIVTSGTFPAVEPARGWRAAVTVSARRESAVALVNPGQSSAEITVSLLDSDGTQLNQYTLTLNPSDRLAAPVWRLAFATCDASGLCEGTPPAAPPKPELFRGTLRMISTVPIAVGGVDVLFPGVTYVSLPITPMQESD